LPSFGNRSAFGGNRNSVLGGFRHFRVAVSSQVISSSNGSWMSNQS